MTAASEYVHLIQGPVSGIACDITGPVLVTERLSEATCPRCQYDGDPVDRTRALQVEAAHAEALAGRTEMDVMQSMTTEQRAGFDAWVASMAYNARIAEDEARETILGWLKDGREAEVRDPVTLLFKPHTIRYTWRNRHWCPGYYDCLRCA